MAAIPFLLLGAIMVLRGSIYIRWPDGKLAQKRRERNQRVGFSTDMGAFGRRVRRLGFFVALVGAFIIGWEQAEDPPKKSPDKVDPSP